MVRMKEEVNIIGGGSGYTEIEIKEDLISNKTVNELICTYTNEVKQGHIQEAYKIIMTYMTKLQRSLEHVVKEWQVSSNLYQGYMDMTFFTMTNELLRSKGLKIAVVYVHPNGSFEAWLSGRNKGAIEKYKTIVNNLSIDNISLFHHKANKDSIVEYTLTSQPDFENQEALTETIQKEVELFINAITKALLN